MKTMRRLKNTLAPRKLRARSEFDVSDATMEPAMDPPPEAVFDRVTGPYGRRHAYGFDEET